MSPNPWLVRPRLNAEAGHRLFCFSFAGAGASVYRGWAQRLPPRVELCAVQLPGRESRFRETAFTDMTALVAELAAALAPFLDRPFAFFGHSMGALVHFELTRQLRRIGKPLPAHLLVSARRGPQVPTQEEPMHPLPELEFRERMRRISGTPPAVLENAELFQLMLPLLRADFRLIETYEFKVESPLEIPITAFGGNADSMVTEQHLDAWREMTTSSFHRRMLPGNHFYIQSAEAEVVEAVLSEWLGAQ